MIYQPLPYLLMILNYSFLLLSLTKKTIFASDLSINTNLSKWWAYPCKPRIGEHTTHVLTEILGYDVDKKADVFASLAMT
jgi:hypothetical protein